MDMYKKLIVLTLVILVASISPISNPTVFAGGGGGGSYVVTPPPPPPPPPLPPPPPPTAQTLILIPPAAQAGTKFYKTINYTQSGCKATCIYSVPGIYNSVVPNGATTAKVVVIGGGGGAGNNPCVGQKCWAGGGGGGAGGYASGTYSVKPGDTISVTVGAGGITIVNGGKGGITKFGNFISATGGFLDSASSNAGGAGGIGTGGSINKRGAAGGSGANGRKGLYYLGPGGVGFRYNGKLHGSGRDGTYEVPGRRKTGNPANDGLVAVTYSPYSNAPSIWNKPTDLAYIIVKLWGGGGGGTAYSKFNRILSGAGGGYSEKLIRSFSLPSSVPVTIGLGGDGGSTSAASVGSSSWFGSSLGAGGGGTSTGFKIGSNQYFIGASGGGGFGGDTNTYGMYSNIGAAGGKSAPDTFSGGFGGGGVSGNSNKNGGAGGVPGGGGAGGRSGGNGGAGQVIVFEYTSTTCPLPWGGTIPNGSSVTAYKVSYVEPPQTCSAVAQTRICANGTLSGSYTNISCVVTPPTLTFTAAPTRVKLNGLTTLTYNATNVNSCTIQKNGTTLKTIQSDSTRTVSGSTTDSITTQSYYKITCANNASTSAVSAVQIVNVGSLFNLF